MCWMVCVSHHWFTLMPAKPSLVFLTFRGKEALICKPNHTIFCKKCLEKCITLYAWLVVQLCEFVCKLGITRP